MSVQLKLAYILNALDDADIEQDASERISPPPRTIPFGAGSVGSVPGAAASGMYPPSASARPPYRAAAHLPEMQMLSRTGNGVCAGV